MGTTYETIRKVVSKPPPDRTQTEVEMLLPWFRKKSELFRSLDTDIVVDILRNCEFSTRQKDNIIIKQGEKGDCFYVILNGSVSIFINNLIADAVEEDDGETVPDDTNLYNDKGELDRGKFGNHIVQIGDPQELQRVRYPECYNESGVFQRSYFGHFIAQISSGKSFGELALINKNCIRNASIIADETTDLIVVYRDLYNRCLKAAQTAEFEERTSFVQNHPVFQHWHAKYKKQMAMSIVKEKIQFNEYICKQGDHVDGMYYLVSGTAKVIMDPAQHETQYPQFYPLQDPDEIEAKEELMADSENNIQRRVEKKFPSTLDNLNAPLPIPPSAQRKREKNKKVFEVSVVGTNECIGDTEITLDMKTYLQSVICTQACSIYVLDLKNYERLVVKRNKPTMDLIRHLAQLKMQCRIERLNSDTIPLLRTLLYKMQCIGKEKDKTRRRGQASHENYPYDIVPPRGALIDLHGPGTVFHRSRQRELAKKKKGMFRGATTGGLGMPDPLKNAMETVGRSGASQNGVYYSTVNNDAFLTKGLEEGDLEQDDTPRQSLKSFCDWTSSDRALSVLEERISAWHTALNEGPPQQQQPQQIATIPGQLSRSPSKLFKLRRVHVGDTKDLKPGTTVLLRKKKTRPKIMFNENGKDEKDGSQSERMSFNDNPRIKDSADSYLHSGGVSGLEEPATGYTALHGIHWPHMNSSATQIPSTLYKSGGTLRPLSPSTSSLITLNYGGTILDLLKRQREMIELYKSRRPRMQSMEEPRLQGLRPVNRLIVTSEGHALKSSEPPEMMVRGKAWADVTQEGPTLPNITPKRSCNFEPASEPKKDMDQLKIPQIVVGRSLINNGQDVTDNGLIK